MEYALKNRASFPLSNLVISVMTQLESISYLSSASQRASFGLIE